MKKPKKDIPLFIVFGLSFIIGLVFLIMPFISHKPDGLQKVSEKTVGFLKKEDFKPVVKAPMPDYTIPILKHNNVKQYAGIIGVFVVFGITVFIGFMLKRRRKNSP
ncbi:MAG: PDGLE domain-containing protein [Planctomycetota bacterium]|nr:PDGLE domain-containing protein [Planctomycetota bacterium]